MNGRRLGFTCSVLAVVCGLLGCQSAFQHDPNYRRKSQPTANESVIGTGRVLLEDSLRLAPKDASADVQATFRCNVRRPEDKLLAGCVDACLAEAYRHMRGEERQGVAATGAKGVRDAFFADYREWFDEDWPAVKAGDIPAYVGQWTCAVEGCVVYCDKRHFSYRVTIDTMTGGPHPNRWVQNATYSRKSGRRLAVADVIRKESMTAVVNLIRKAVLAQAQEDQLRGQLEAEIRQPYAEYVRDIRSRRRDEWGNPLVTENFLLTKGGIEWVYNQYEIACYASGIFTALIRWDAIGPHLRDRTMAGE